MGYHGLRVARNFRGLRENAAVRRAEEALKGTAYSAFRPTHPAVVSDRVFPRDVPEVSKGGVHVGHRQLREAAYDFVRAFPLKLVPLINVLDANARPGNTGLSAEHVGVQAM